MRWIVIILTCMALIGCERSDQAEQNVGVTQLSIWAHAGQVAEREVIERQLQAFDRKHADISIKLTFIPERSYNAQVQAAAIAGDLPDLLEFDAPYLYNYAWQGKLLPLENLLSKNIQQDLLPSIIQQGTYREHLYAVGMFDSGLGLYGRRHMLQKIGARIPTDPAHAWSVQEFETVLQKLVAIDENEDGAVLDLKLNYPDEWFTYGFSPIVQSAGGGLVDRKGEQTASGVLNGPQSVTAMQHLQNWFQHGWVDANVDDAAFVNRRVALSWAGHWEYQRYFADVGKDLVVLPLPDFGHGSRTGQGSWVWGISKQTGAAQQAVRVIEYLLQSPQILNMTEANGAVPATRTAIAKSELYQPGGPLHLFAEQLIEGYAVARPKTPAYPVISASFRQAFADIRNGMLVRQALDQAAARIDEEIRENRGYPPIDAR